jgi:hypothetical protein
LWVRRFRGHTVSGRGFNLIKPLPRHLQSYRTRRGNANARGAGNIFAPRLGVRRVNLRATRGRRRRSEAARLTFGSILSLRSRYHSFRLMYTVCSQFELHV